LFFSVPTPPPGPTTNHISVSPHITSGYTVSSSSVGIYSVDSCSLPYHSYWLLDSGANEHICSHLPHFTSLYPIKPVYVTFPNNTIVVIDQAGTIIFSPQFYLTNVLYSSTFKLNLMFVAKVCQSLSCVFHFSNKQCIIQDKTSLKMIGLASQQDGLYKFHSSNLASINSISSTINVPCTSVSTVTCNSSHYIHVKALWHFRLGHLSHQRMDKMSFWYSSIINDNKARCDICQFAKQKHVPFTSSLSHASSNFELLHLDIWGPLFVPFVHGHKYFLTIVDDHSRFLLIILLKSKAEVANHVKSFITMIQNQFQVTPKFIRSDNGLEFMLSEFYASLGILHQKSCVETPQQNARVERKHQHILNVGKALLFQSKLPSSYWSYAILHAVFLINRITNPIIQNQSPFQVLYNKLPDISSFKVFGCLCYASSLQVHRTKLHPRARKSIFLGYKSGYKGFTLLDMHSRDIFISRHVIFHEHILPYPINPDSITSQWEYFPSPHTTPHSPSSDVVHVPPLIIDDPPFESSHNNNNTPSPILLVPTRQSTRTSNTPAYLKDYVCNNIHASLYPITFYISHNKLFDQHSCFVLSLHSNPEPNHSLRQTNLTAGSKQWKLNFLLLSQLVHGN